MKNSLEPRKKQKVAAMLWYNQGDAAAKVDEDVELCCCGGGGGARALRCREEEDDGKGRVTKT